MMRCKVVLIQITDTPEQQKRFADNPQLFLKYSKMIESELNVRFKFILNGTPEAEGAKEVIRTHNMLSKCNVADPKSLSSRARR